MVVLRDQWIRASNFGYSHRQEFWREIQKKTRVAEFVDAFLKEWKKYNFDEFLSDSVEKKTSTVCVAQSVRYAVVFHMLCLRVSNRYRLYKIIVNMYERM